MSTAATGLLNAQQLNTGVHHHVQRAQALLAEADVELAAATPATVPARVAHRVQLAQAHATVALALSTALVPMAPVAMGAPAAPAG